MQELILDSDLDAQKRFAWWLYVAHAVSFLFTLGMISFVPLILNYLKRGETAGTFVHSHHSWMIRSFWWYVVWVGIGVLLVVTIVGMLVAWIVFAGAWLWKAYRLVKGFLDLNANRAMPY